MIISSQASNVFTILTILCFFTGIISLVKVYGKIAGILPTIGNKLNLSYTANLLVAAAAIAFIHMALSHQTETLILVELLVHNFKLTVVALGSVTLVTLVQMFTVPAFDKA